MMFSQGSVTNCLSTASSHRCTQKLNKDWSSESLDLTTKLLQINPELYTVWNYRRNILVKGIFPESSAQEVNDLLANDLAMTTGALKAHPKVYWIWNHRRWCLENFPAGPGEDDGWKKANWDREMFVVERMLDVDARNCEFHLCRIGCQYRVLMELPVHAWSYRRYVLARMTTQRSDESELHYTTKKIESNFSNFSAWHQRSKVLTAMWSSGTLDPLRSKEEGMWFHLFTSHANV